MKLVNTARWADTTRLFDAYNPTLHVLNAQVSSFIDNQLDGSISKRRPISYAPDQVLPARRVVTYEDERWIVGDHMVDMWRGKPIRVSAATKKVTGLYKIRTPGQAALDADGVEAFGQLIYLKDTVNTTTTSQYSPQYEVYFSSTEPLAKWKLIFTPDNILHVRSCYPVLDGFVCAVSDELGLEARQPVQFKTRAAYDPTSDSYPTTNVDTFGIVVDYYKLYAKETAMAYRQEMGDLTLLVAASAVAPKVGETLSLYGLQWRVLASNPDQDCWRLHIRRV